MFAKIFCARTKLRKHLIGEIKELVKWAKLLGNPMLGVLWSTHLSEINLGNTQSVNKLIVTWNNWNRVPMQDKLCDFLLFF